MNGSRLLNGRSLSVHGYQSVPEGGKPPLAEKSMKFGSFHGERRASAAGSWKGERKGERQCGFPPIRAIATLPIAARE
jgi:hypothetical protein